jgi:hypothetical protein
MERKTENDLLNSPKVCAIIQHWIGNAMGGLGGKSFALSNALGTAGRNGCHHGRNNQERWKWIVNEKR